MVVMSAEVELFLASSRSLKEKRQVISSLKDRLRTRFQLAVAEVDHQELWQRCVLGLATVSGSAQRAEEVLSGALRFIEEDLRVQVIHRYIEER